MRSQLQLVVLLTVTLLSITTSAKGTMYIIKADGTGDAPTIQAGIDVASDGDVVMLEPGTFTGAGNRDVDFNGKAITVTSSGGPAVTIIDGQGVADRGFVFSNFETSAAVVSGLTIRNGLNGVVCSDASPTITGNVIENNSGSGVSYGGGSVALIGNTIRSNGRRGVEITGSSGSCENNVISGNTNTAYGGGGVLLQGTTVSVVGNVIVGNSTTSDGGGIRVYEGSGLIADNVFAENSASRGGGIFVAWSGGLTLQGNTVAENSAVTGSGVFVENSVGSVSLLTTIVAFNTGGSGLECSGSVTMSVSCCDIFDNGGGDALCGVDGGNNISLNPMFCGMLGSGVYDIAVPSPCTASKSPCGQRIGALPPNCSSLAVQETTWGAIKYRYEPSQ